MRVNAIVSAPSMPGRAAGQPGARRRAATIGTSMLAAQPDELRDLGGRRRGARPRAAGPAGRYAVSSRRYDSRSTGSVSRRRSGRRASIARSSAGPSPRTPPRAAPPAVVVGIVSFAMATVSPFGGRPPRARSTIRPCSRFPARRVVTGLSIALLGLAGLPRPPPARPPAAGASAGRRGGVGHRPGHPSTGPASRSGPRTTWTSGSPSRARTLRGRVTITARNRSGAGHRPARAQHGHGARSGRCGWAPSPWTARDGRRRPSTTRRSSSRSAACCPTAPRPPIVVPFSATLRSTH